jgi:capsular polysaccharide export protein
MVNYESVNTIGTPMLGTFSAGISRRRLLPGALATKIRHIPRRPNNSVVGGIIGWGLKENTQTAYRYAVANTLPYLTLEDGFIRSIGLGVSGAEPFGFIVDTTGIYYDATRPSDLETLIKSNTTVECGRIRNLIQRIIADKINKYNYVWDSLILPDSQRPKILLIDQTHGDLSVDYGLADESSFRRMLDAAKTKYPDGDFFVKIHPDVIAGKKKGYLSDHLPDDVRHIGEDCNPIELLLQVDHVFTVTSQMGFEALLVGKKVSCFGMPFYAGWGLTEDYVDCPRRGIKRSLEDIFDAAYLRYTRYVDPFSEKRCRLERILEIIESHKRMTTQNKGNIFCFGFRLRKRGIVRQFLSSRDTRIFFVGSVKQAERIGIGRTSRIVVWGLNENRAIVNLANRHGIQIERIEDGFIRSVGLGSDFARPSSLILDRRGIYFDPRQPSDLENLLNTIHLDQKATRRVQQLHRHIVSTGINKYNNGSKKKLVVNASPFQTVILVPGQVEDDASIRVGCTEIRTNLGLLQEVRCKNPNAYLIYKPHPDVIAGNRQGRIPNDVAERYCDQIVTEHHMNICLDQVDQVHTMTSLTGFEALLKKKQVFTYGLPFYAGWGLTTDQLGIDRRRRKLTLEELIYGCLVLYPRYVNWDFGCFVEAEDTVRMLDKQQKGACAVISASYFRRWVRKALYLLEDMQIVWAK